MSAIEDVLVAHPAVAAAAAMDLPDGAGTATMSVFISIAADHQLELREIQDWAHDRCAASDLPQRWLFINQMPLASDGSIDRGMLRDLVVGAR